MDTGRISNHFWEVVYFVKAIADGIRIQYNENQKPELVLAISSGRYELLQGVTELKEAAKEKKLSVEVKQHREKRSLDANSYLWVLCQKIAEALKTTKELVYKKAIRDVGQWEVVPIKNEAVERWIEVWSSKGLGWFAEVLEDSKLAGYKKVISYYGSSVYDTREMSVLIDEVINTCNELHIEVLPPHELADLKNEWGKKSE
jgi:hypothetical protein